MLTLFGLFCILYLYTSLALPWMLNRRVRRLEEEVEILRYSSPQERTQAALEKVFAPPAPKAQAVSPALAETTDSAEITEVRTTEDAMKEANPPLAYPPSEKHSWNFEQQFGARLPVWIGGVALALAGFFMVKYSIETGLLTPWVRFMLGCAFGTSLIVSAHTIGPRIHDARIPQALSGAGIAVLYGCFYMAGERYQLLPQSLAFAGMTAVTGYAILLALRYGMPIAILGMVGGFLSPALTSAQEPNAAFLFTYLYGITAGLLYIIRRQQWWHLLMPLTLAGFGWVLLWVISGTFNSTDSFWLGLFLIAVSISVAASTHEQEMPRTFFARQTHYVTLGSAIFLMGLVASEAGFSLMEWGMFALLSMAGITLRYFAPQRYHYVPLLSLAVNLAMLANWNTPSDALFAGVCLFFGLLYTLTGSYLQTRTSSAFAWALQVAGASLGYYLLAYLRLEHSALVINIPVFWGGLAMLLAGMHTLLLKQVMARIDAANPAKALMISVHTVAATSFITLGLGIEMEREFFSVAVAGEVLALAWLSTKWRIPALMQLSAALAALFALLLFPQIVLLLQLTAYSVLEAKLHLQNNVPMVNWPLFQLGVPALFFAASSVYLRRHDDGYLVRAFETASIALLGVMGYYLMRHAFHTPQDVLFVKAGFIERGAITNSVFLYALACFWGGRRFSRSTLSLGGLTLACIALFRIGYFDLLLYNPLWSSQLIGAWPLLNGLSLTYALPAIWLYVACRYLPDTGMRHWQHYGHGIIMLLAFAWANFSLRQLFHGEILYQGISTSAEIYSYSVLWLGMGIAMLFFGMKHQHKGLRMGALVMMLLTITKVFLFDASELEGLLRVFSFLGLGVSLILLSWVYTRFIFPAARTPQTERLQ